MRWDLALWQAKRTALGPRYSRRVKLKKGTQRVAIRLSSAIMRKATGPSRKGIFLRFTLIDREGESWTYFNDANSLKLRQ